MLSKPRKALSACSSTALIIAAIRSVPPGQVAAYGQIAALAGIPNGARQVARILHSSSGKRDLPWWRILRSDGSIALPEGAGGGQQRQLLEAEGVGFLANGRVDLARHRFGG